METKIKYGIFIGVAILLMIGVFILLNDQKYVLKPDNIKYCETADDCVTSCGGKIGRGNSYNKAFVTPGNPLDNVCCQCENCQLCITSECIDNVCTPKGTGGTCC